MTKADIYMRQAIEKILLTGYADVDPRPKYKDGISAHTLSVNHVIRSYNLAKGEFPICTLRPQAWKSAIKEMFWIYQDQTSDLNILQNTYRINYWNEWESKDVPETVGQRYGATVHRYNLIDNLIKDIQTNPYGRRKIVDLWQETDLDETDGIAPCAFLSIWNVRNVIENNTYNEYLDMCLIQRSGDMLVASGAGGINEIQYAALLMMIARHCGYKAGVFTHFVANEQIYDRHIPQAKEMLRRANDLEKSNLNEVTNLPNLTFNPKINNFYDFTIDDFTMLYYEPVYPQIQFDLGI